MRRIDAIGVALGFFLAGGLLYGLLLVLGLDSQTAGIWSQGVLVLGLLGWVLTYLFRVSNHQMTYNQQLKDYQDAVLQKRLEELTPEELAQLQADGDKDEPKAVD